MSSTPPVDRAIRVLEAALGELKKVKETAGERGEAKTEDLPAAGRPSPLQTVSTIRWRDSLRG